MHFEQFKHFITTTLNINPTHEEWLLFEKKLKVKRYRAGDIALFEGNICSEILFINKGVMRLYYIKNGEEINTYFSLENTLMFNYKSFLKKEPAKYYIQALTDIESIVLSYDLLHENLNTFYHWEKLGRVLTESYYLKLVERVESFLFMTAEERYLQLLSEYPQIFERVPLFHIASYLGVKNSSLSRIRKTLHNKSL